MLQTACSMFEFNCSLVRLIFAAEKRLFTLVSIASLQSPLVFYDLRALYRICYNSGALRYLSK